MNKQKGQAAILIIFILGMVSILVGLSLAQTGFGESIMGRTETASAHAFYLANSGVEDAFYRINHGFGEGSYDFDLENGHVDVTITSVPEKEDHKIIETTGTHQNYVRKIRVEAKNTSLLPGFAHAIHAGLGGAELRNNTVVTGMDGEPGNIFSNSFVKGAKNAYDFKNDECHNSASAVWGSVWAVGEIMKLAENDTGVCIMEEARAGSLVECFIKGNSYSLDDSQTPNCDSLGGWEKAEDPLDPEPLPNMGVDELEKRFKEENWGTPWPGDCVIDGGISDCSEGDNVIGDMIIQGDLIKPSNTDLYFSGPVWVEGKIILNSLGTVSPEADPKIKVSQLIVAEEQIQVDSNIIFDPYINPELAEGENKIFLLFISEYDPTVEDPTLTELCDDPSISLSSNTESVLFYATEGCVEITANSTFYGAILGERILVDNNSTVEYDPDLQTAIFGLTTTGGWQTISFKEE